MILKIFAVSNDGTAKEITSLIIGSQLNLVNGRMPRWAAVSKVDFEPHHAKLFRDKFGADDFAKSEEATFKDKNLGGTPLTASQLYDIMPLTYEFVPESDDPVIPTPHDDGARESASPDPEAQAEPRFKIADLTPRKFAEKYTLDKYTIYIDKSNGGTTIVKYTSAVNKHVGLWFYIDDVSGLLYSIYVLSDDNTEGNAELYDASQFSQLFIMLYKMIVSGDLKMVEAGE